LNPVTIILQAIKNTVSSNPAVTVSRDGTGAEGAGAGIVVIGETPYAEGLGDRANLNLSTDNMATIIRVRNAGIPVVVILISGRPMIVSPWIDYCEAFIAAWLPGTEGQGVADVLFGDYNPTGKLSHSWPREMSQIPINAGDRSMIRCLPTDTGSVIE
jgi:beta-glucosidase